MQSFARVVCFLLTIIAAVPTSAELVLDESPCKEGEWGFRPDNVTVKVAPPGFSWRPCRNAKTYELEVARDGQFSDMVLRSEAILWPAYCPAQPMDPGKYFWRYRARDEGGTSKWSMVREFIVDKDAVVFPQPARDELKQRMPAAHPRLFFRDEDLTKLREQAQGPLAERWAALRKVADKLLKNPPDTSDPPKYPPEVDRSKTPDEWKKIWWGNRARVVAVADGAATLAFVYRVSGEDQYGRAARDLLMATTTWDLKGGTNYEYNDEAAMPMLYMAARAYTWCHPVLTDEEKVAVVAMMRERGLQAYRHLRAGPHLWKPYASHSNRAWHLLGETAIAFYDDIPEAAEWLDYAMTIFHTAYPVWGDDDGGWHEGVAYWNSYMSLFMNWASVMASALRIDAFRKPFFQHTGDFAMYTMPPGTKSGAFGDCTQGTTSESLAPLMLLMANGARNPNWKWYADASSAKPGAGYLGFLHAVQLAGLEGTPPTTLPVSREFGGNLAVLNTNLLDATDNIQLHFKSSAFGRQSHGYNANNAFLLNMNGKRAFIQSGNRDLYGSLHHKNWMWETRSDNAILVNGKGQRSHTADAQGGIYYFSSAEQGVDAVAGEAGSAYDNLAKWARRIFFFKPHVILIHDVLEAPEPSTFDWLLHALGSFTIDGNDVRWRGDAGTARIRFLEPAGLAISQTDVMDPPPADYARLNWQEWHLDAQTKEPARHREFIVLIELNGADAQAQYEPGQPALVNLKFPDRTAAVVLQRESSRYTVAKDGNQYSWKCQTTQGQ